MAVSTDVSSVTRHAEIENAMRVLRMRSLEPVKAYLRREYELSHEEADVLERAHRSRRPVVDAVVLNGGSGRQAVEV